MIGVGGGRDILTAFWADNTSITGIEINEVLVRVLPAGLSGFREGRDAARSHARERRGQIVPDSNRPTVRRAADVADRYLAATGAGAFRLWESGLYTREGWHVFLRALTPAGVFSVSRWFDPDAASETTRLLSLAIASPLDFGIDTPRSHVIVITRERVATLIVSPPAFTDRDQSRLQEVADAMGFAIGASPWHGGRRTAPPDRRGALGR